MKNTILVFAVLFIGLGCGPKTKEPCGGSCKNGKECSTNDVCQCPTSTYDLSNACVAKGNSYYSVSSCLCIDTLVCSIGSATGVGNRRFFIMQTPSLEFTNGYITNDTDCEYFEKADGDSLSFRAVSMGCKVSNGSNIFPEMLGKLSVDKKQINMRILWRRGLFPFEVVDSCVKVFSRQ